MQTSFQVREHAIHFDRLPNQALVSSLYKDYAKNGIQSSPLHTSDWWNDSVATLEVKENSGAGLFSFTCSGYGGYQYRIPLIKRVLESFSHLSYRLSLDIRRELQPLIAPSKKICRKMEILFTHDIFKQTCTLALMMRFIPREQRSKPARWLLIGDGFGFLGSLIKEVFPEASVCFVDLGKSLFIQAVKCQQAHPHRKHVPTEASKDFSEDFIYCPAEKLESMNTSFDYACSVVAMHEMKREEISRYFQFLRRHLKRDNLFYCSSRSKKTHPSGYVTEFEKYGWSSQDEVLADGECPWLKYMAAHFPRKNWHHGLVPVKFLGLTVPGMMAFGGPSDGPIVHRLCRLSAV